MAIQDDRRTETYRELDAMANRFGHWAQSRRLKRGDTIALVMLNRAEYIAAWMGFAKVGVGTALINTKAWAAQGLQIAAGVPLACDEPADFRSFRIGLFGLDKLQNVERTVQNFKAALDRIE